MAYLPLIPGAAQRLKDSQPQIQNNFAEIQTLITANHEDFNTANAGKHKFLQMPEQVASPTTAVNEGGLFTRQGTTTAVTELAWRRENNGTVTEITAGSLGATGWSYLPSGLLMKWGAAASGSFPINLNLIGPAYTTLYNVQLTVRGGGTAEYVIVNNATTTAASLGITLGGVGAVTVIYWVTYGV